ncbi:translocation/assembly module TamB domain-containing protein [Maritimibacter sp. UBA3975]|nr:translocation/assembly module TamB domain-containing protein [Maritimibacter sp. UBA3975]
MTRLLSLLALLTWIALPAFAQDETQQEEEDKSVLENFLQDNLSSDGMQVTVNGFSGALSRQATMDEMTFADDDGVWLRLEGVTLTWDRSAILQRRVEVRELSAEIIELVRLPQSGGDGPSSEASDFTLPELPVSVDIDRLAAERLILGEPVLGERMEMTLEGSGDLVDGQGEAQLDLERIDGQRGSFNLAASYSNESHVLAVDLSLDEGPGGIVAKLANLPGEPALTLTVDGEDTLDDFTADVMLGTDGESRLGGQVRIRAEKAGEDGVRESDMRVDADFSGDLRPLFEEQYQPFFGGESLLHLEGARFPNGTIRVEDLFVRTDALNLRGDATINDKGWPERVNLTGRVANADGSPTTLPASGEPTRISALDLDFDYDSLRGERWTGSFDLTGLERGDISLDSLSFSGAGTLEPGGGDAVPSVDGSVTLSLAGINPGDEDLAAAIGDRIGGSLTFAKGDNTPFNFTDIALSGEDYGLTGDVTLRTELEQLDLVADMDVELTADRLARFAPLSGQDLTGGAALSVRGEVALPDGPFDLEIDGETRDLSIGIEQVDALLAGESRLSIDVDRTVERTALNRFTIAGPGLAASATGELRSEGSTIDAQIDIPDAGRLDDRLEGNVSLVADAVQAGDGWTVEGEATAPGNVVVDFTATATMTDDGVGPVTASLTAAADSIAPYSGLAGRSLSGAIDLAASVSGDLRTQAIDLSGTAQGQDLAFGAGDADQLFAGASEVTFNLRRDEAGTLFVDQLDVDTPELTVSADGTSEGGQSRVNFDARLANVGIFVPELPGAFSAQGTAVLTDDAYRLDVDGQGPDGITVSVAGTVAGSGDSANLSINGVAPLELANGFTGANRVDGTARFDLGLNGPLALTSLSGTVSTSDARVSVPAAAISLDPIQANILLQNGRARIEAGAGVSSGGRVEVAGPVSLEGGYNADLVVRLQGVGLTDPALYDTTVDGQLTVTGPLTGGARVAGTIRPGVVEIRIPSSGFGVAGDLEGLRHINEPAAVRATRARADKLGGTSSGGGGPAYPLDIVIDAPNQVFVRGRGLDAEVGGRLLLRGTTANVVPQGGLSLIRGRLSLLGNRIDLTEARATLEGNFDPYISVTAQTTVDDTTIQIRLDGQATNPEISFTSTPDLPEDEILARLLFGRSIAEISPLQALRMANGVATLTGGGGGVIGNLREGFGLADLDVGQNEGGAVAVRAGTYITENVYTGVEVGADGEAEVNINLDLTRNLTARGSVATNGETSLGIHFEKDY